MSWYTSTLVRMCRFVPGAPQFASIYPWTLPVDFGVVVHPRRLHFNSWCRRVFIQRYHDSVFAGHLDVSQTVCRLLDYVYWPGLREDVQSYLASWSVCLACKTPYPRWSPMGHVSVGHRWDRVAMDILDMSVSTERGNHYVIFDCFSRRTEACPLPNKMAVAMAANLKITSCITSQMIRCRTGLVCPQQGAHKTRTAPYHLASDGLVERFNHSLLMMLAMFAGNTAMTGTISYQQ